MNTIRRQRLFVIVFTCLGVGTTVALAALALRQNINLFFTPAELYEGKAHMHQRIRIGGIVAPNSVKHNPNDLSVQFTITDKKHSIAVFYKGLLPDLFKEGSGIVALGHLEESHLFHANEILAKHDANYMPAEVKKAVDHLHTQQSKSHTSTLSSEELL